MPRMHKIQCFLFLLKFSEVNGRNNTYSLEHCILIGDVMGKVPETVTSLLCRLKTHDVAANCGKEDACDALHVYYLSGYLSAYLSMYTSTYLSILQIHP